MNNNRCWRPVADGRLRFPRKRMLGLALALIGLCSASASAQNRRTARAGGDRDFEQTTLGKTFRIEWGAFSGVVEWLDGPAGEGMGRPMGGSGVQGCLMGMQSDAAGNIYMCDMNSGMIRVRRESDGMLLTIAGNGHVASDRPFGPEGPAYRLGLDQNVHMAAVGTPLEGKGSLYLTAQGRVVRLFRHPKHENRWWYETVAGGGKTRMADGRSYTALDIQLYQPRVAVSADGRIGVSRMTGGRDARRNVFYWLRDGKLVPACDEEAIRKSAGELLNFYGFDGANNFVGSSAGRGSRLLLAVAPDGKTVKHKITVPFGLSWGVYPDPLREQWYVKGMDHYTITRVTPDGKTATLLNDGSWHEHAQGMSSRGYNLKDGLGWMWVLPLQDGRMVGWNSHGCLPLFVGTWLDGASATGRGDR